MRDGDADTRESMIYTSGHGIAPLRNVVENALVVAHDNGSATVHVASTEVVYIVAKLGDIAASRHVDIRGTLGYLYPPR
jgi:hypothetical protein